MNALAYSKQLAPSIAAGVQWVEELRAEDEVEVLAFLDQRPAHTFGMAGFIRANGLVSPHNRGAFYACRDAEDNIEGVALIGHFVMFEAYSEQAIEAFAELAQTYPIVHLLLGEQEKVQRFWDFYAAGGQAPRRYCRELLMEQRWPVEVRKSVPGLRQARPDHLRLIVPVHAQSAYEESGIDPLEVDPEGFYRRCARRVEQGRTWVLVDNNKLIFKAEVVADTPHVAYLEGVWVNPEERGRGWGLRCLSQLTRTLLLHSKSVCLLVNEQNRQAVAFYKRAGYKLISNYDTIFLSRRD
jgi:hypothetical protein